MFSGGFGRMEPELLFFFSFLLLPLPSPFPPPPTALAATPRLARPARSTVEPPLALLHCSATGSDFLIYLLCFAPLCWSSSTTAPSASVFLSKSAAVTQPSLAAVRRPSPLCFVRRRALLCFAHHDRLLAGRFSTVSLVSARLCVHRRSILLLRFCLQTLLCFTVLQNLSPEVSLPSSREAPSGSASLPSQAALVLPPWYCFAEISFSAPLPLLFLVLFCCSACFVVVIELLLDLNGCRIGNGF